MDPKGKTDNGNCAWLDEQLSQGINADNNKLELIQILGSVWKSPEVSETIFPKLNNYMLICNETNDSSNYKMLLLCLMYYIRDCRNGLGRKDSSRIILAFFCNHFSSDIVEPILEEYFKSGYWGDAMNILCMDKESNIGEYTFNNNIKNIIISIVVKQLNQDIEKVKNKENPSNCAKWVKLSKAKVGSKGKDRTMLSFLIAQKMFPNIKANTTFCKVVNNQVDFTKVYPVVETTPLYFKYRTLISTYEKVVRNLRKYIPYVEKDMKDYSKINPSALTGSNKLKLDKAFKNELPKYLNGKTKCTITDKKKNMYTKKYKNSDNIRFNIESRKQFAIKYIEYEKEVAIKLKEKVNKLKELYNKVDKTEEDLEEIKLLTETKTTNFSSATPLDIYNAYCPNNKIGNSGTNIMYENAILELTCKMSNIINMDMLCVADTSGSMYSNYKGISPISACIALTAFCSANSKNKHKFIQFADTSYLVDMKDHYENPTFYDYIKYMQEHSVNVGSTNFESVLELLRKMFTQNVNIPKYLIFFSDMQFNQAVQIGNINLTAKEQVEKLFKELGYDTFPTIIFWNLAQNDTSPCLLSDQGVVLLSGYTTQMLLDLDNIINDPTSYNNAYNEILVLNDNKNKVDTWSTIVKTLINSKACENILTNEIIKNNLNHTLKN